MSVILLSNKLKEIFLNDFHKNHGSKFIPFAGYSMPINYSKGIIKEHLHTRKLVSVFEIKIAPVASTQYRFPN